MKFHDQEKGSLGLQFDSKKLERRCNFRCATTKRTIAALDLLAINYYRTSTEQSTKKGEKHCNLHRSSKVDSGPFIIIKSRTYKRNVCLRISACIFEFMLFAGEFSFLLSIVATNKTKSFPCRSQICDRARREVMLKSETSEKDFPNSSAHEFGGGEIFQICLLTAG